MDRGDASGVTARTAIALTVAGSDSGGGAGVQADLRTFAALGVHGASAITALTAQNTEGVRAIHYAPPGIVAAQIEAVLSDFAVAAIKIGMLGTAEIVGAVAEKLLSCARGEGVRPFIVYDPVMIASSGDPLSGAGFAAAIKTKLLPLVDCLTPNLAEAAALIGAPVAGSEAEMARQGVALLALGPRAVLMKGGHLAGEEAVDLLIARDRTLRIRRRENRLSQSAWDRMRAVERDRRACGARPAPDRGRPGGEGVRGPGDRGGARVAVRRGSGALGAPAHRAKGSRLGVGFPDAVRSAQADAEGRRHLTQGDMYPFSTLFARPLLRARPRFANLGDMDASSDNRTPESAAPQLTPMMAQYLDIKAANPDCLLFYRMGDFYELFFGDAEIASRALGIVLTKRGKHEGEDIRMCGVPVERADDYLNRLIALGHRVAVCEQLEDPAEAKKRGAKSVVKRDVVRLVTPGTITEERLLEPGRARLLVAVQRIRANEGRWTYGLAALDLSTGAFALTEADEAGLAAEIARLEPSEVVASQAVADEPLFSRLISEIRAPLTPLAREVGDAAAAGRLVREFYGVDTLDGFGAFTRAEIAAAALALAYVKRTQLEARPALSPPTRRARGTSLEIDPATRANLELTRTSGGAREGSLLATIDLTATPAGARLLAERLASPLTDPEAINARLLSLDCLLEAASLREALRRALAGAPDFVRALARLGLDRAGPRDLAAIRDGVVAAKTLARILSAAGDLPPELLDACARLGAECGALESDLQSTLAKELPLLKRDGGFVRPGASQALDEARRLRDESRRVIAELQASYAEQAGAKALRIKHNNFLGYYIETPQAQGETLLKAPLNATFIHRQTMAGAMRFTTNALIDLQSRIASSADSALTLELEAFERLRRACLDRRRAFARFRRGAGRSRRRRRARRTRGEARLEPTAGRRFARVCDRGRAPSGGRGGAEGSGRAVRRQ